MSKEKEAIVTVFDLRGEPPEQYDQTVKALEAVGVGSPQGRLYHVACLKEGEVMVVDVWESQELFERFAQTLGTVAQEVGSTKAVPKIYPVHNIIKG